jgi:putative membrane protein
MWVRIFLASVHLLGLGIGLGAIWTRARSLVSELDERALRRAFVADNFWGAAAGIWLLTGLARAFAGFEKGSAYYLNNSFFWVKMSLFVAILALEARPMIGLIGWRVRLKKNQPLDLAQARSYGIISHIQAALVVVMVVVASAMARGCG